MRLVSSVGVRGGERGGEERASADRGDASAHSAKKTRELWCSGRHDACATARARAGSLRVLLQRAQSLAMWMIEAASYIDLDDARWSCIMLYEKTVPWASSSPSQVSFSVLPCLLFCPLFVVLSSLPAPLVARTRARRPSRPGRGGFLGQGCLTAGRRTASCCQAVCSRTSPNAPPPALPELRSPACVFVYACVCVCVCMCMCVCCAGSRTRLPPAWPARGLVHGSLVVHDDVTASSRDCLPCVCIHVAHSRRGAAKRRRAQSTGW